MAIVVGAGQRDRRIIVQHRPDDDEVPQDDLGRKAAVWPEFCRFWANVREVTARDRLSAPGTLPVRSATMTVLYPPDRFKVTSDMRISYDGELWEIRGLAERTDAGRRRLLEITAEVLEAPGRV